MFPLDVEREPSKHVFPLAASRVLFASSCSTNREQPIRAEGTVSTSIGLT